MSGWEAKLGDLRDVVYIETATDQGAERIMAAVFVFVDAVLEQATTDIAEEIAAYKATLGRPHDL